MKPSKLRAVNMAGAGLQIHALIDEPVNCVEATMKGDCYQMVANEPWIQFAPAEWDTMIKKLFGEMIDAWNEKHSI